MTRREWLMAASGALVVAAPLRSLGAQGTAGNVLEVWKSPTCGCCGNWVAHMRANGFTTTVHDIADVAPIKRKHGVPPALESCHTALVGGIVLEGHVPADLVRQLQQQRKANAVVLGLAVPGMPVGSPGMEQGDRKDSYDVIAFDKKGLTKVFARR
ncbi:MAG: DUF411 domain-containing protein [Acidobacteria bacterium]|nr:DUF411 domain-containing protein [Acidobacteriota bacterium]